MSNDGNCDNCDTEETEQCYPLPPPPPPRNPYLVKEKPYTVSRNISQPILNEATWALDDDSTELQRACFFGRVCLHKAPKEYYYHRTIYGILQNGPTCGLTAISMLLQGKLTAADLLAKAQSKNFSNNGEMFSTSNLLELLQDVNTGLYHNERVFNSQLWSGALDCCEIKCTLRNKSLLLVPYDADVNHAPTALQGHKAHWAIVVGYLIDEFDYFYVLARHGKSRHLAAWSLKELSCSNMNLNEFKQPKEHPDVFLLPEGGISGPMGLKGKSIVIEVVNK